jgi:hypothetical protein
MANNYDASQVGVPYVRIPSFTLDYPSPGNARVEAQEVSAVKLANGEVKVIDKIGVLAFRIQSHQLAETFPLINPDTGANLGASMSYQQLMIGITSALRKAQIERDTPPAIVTPTEPEAP